MCLKGSGRNSYRPTQADGNGCLAFAISWRPVAFFLHRSCNQRGRMTVSAESSRRHSYRLVRLERAASRRNGKVSRRGLCVGGVECAMRRSNVALRGIRDDPGLSAYSFASSPRRTSAGSAVSSARHIRSPTQPIRAMADSSTPDSSPNRG